MSTVEQIRAAIQQLPESLQAEVLHYAEYLLSRTQQNGDTYARGQAMADTLARLAAYPERITDEDPITWQRAQRQDRDLPSR